MFDQKSKNFLRKVRSEKTASRCELFTTSASVMIMSQSTKKAMSKGEVINKSDDLTVASTFIYVLQL